ncbi:MAG: thioredoxin domain-containing protein [Rudaea sp.]
MTNRLSLEASPYLRQHEDNPVDWWPWSAEALALARAQDKPILLSIGYSACHWCHVMAHESFEDEDTARRMNEWFVCIKVDREERPDIDKIYQLAHQALTRRGGGWPLTVFLAADDLTPFYAGTYFPREARHGMPPFGYVLEQVRGFWDRQRDEVRKQNAVLREFLADHGRSEATTAALTLAPVRAALAQIAQNFDRQYGGHLGAPKFPHGAEMELLLDLATPDALAMVGLSLARIAAGGIHDQIGGGFCRYSVDERWEIPHFEKMLYDNAQLLPLYAESGGDANAKTIRRLIAWLRREMTATAGGFHAALDADSEHEEGKFYVWQRDEVRALLDDDEFAAAEPYWGFDRAPNFEHVAWNPIGARGVDDVAAALSLPRSEVQTRIERAREKLFAARARRARPGLDDKVLTAWNALMIGGLARAARAPARAGEPDGVDCSVIAEMLSLARAALAFLHANAWRNGRLFAKTGGDSARFPAYLDDHAFLLDAIVEFLQCEWDDGKLAWAIALADALLARFEDTRDGGFWFTAHDHEALIQRPKPFADDAIPAGNGVAARALLRLGHLLGETRYLDAAERALRAGFATMQQVPQACASMQRALNDFLEPRTHIVVRASAGEESAWRAALAQRGDRRTDAYVIPAHAPALPGILAAQAHAAGGVAYVCRGTQCEPATGSPEALAASL